MTKLIKKSTQPLKRFNLNDQVIFEVWIPLQNIGSTTEDRIGTIVKINRKTVDVIDNEGNTWRVGMDEIK